MTVRVKANGAWSEGDLHVKVDGAWRQIGGGGASGVPWAKVTGGTVTTYTKPDGSVMEVHTFTANGTLDVVTPGYADVLLVGGGSGGTGGTYGNGGDVRAGLWALPSGAHAVAVAPAGASGPLSSASSIGTLLRAAQVWVSPADLGYGVGAGAVYTGSAPYADTAKGYTSDITGAMVEYGKAGSGSSGAGAPNTGNGGANGTTGGSGVVIVAVQKSPPTVSGIVATGGTVTEFTGDGVNGVLGQRYRVHTFTASGSLDVTQGGACDLLVVGGGGAGGFTANAQSNVGGGGGGSRPVRVNRVLLSAGSNPVEVGEGAVHDSFVRNGGLSSFLGVVVPGGASALAVLAGGWTVRPGAQANGSGGNSQIESPGTLSMFADGFPGGNGGNAAGSNTGGGGGGGAGGPGQPGTGSVGGNGGPGQSINFDGTLRTFGGGGGGGRLNGTPGLGGSGGGGTGETGVPGQVNATSGAANTGGGGGGAWASNAPGNGGSGVVIVRYEIA